MPKMVIDTDPRLTDARTPTAHTHAGNGGGARGFAIVDFGVFPGKSDAIVAVTGQTAILSGSSVRVDKRLAATADHSADEHWIEEWDVAAGNIIEGTGFTIYAKTRNSRLFGQWSVSWQWS